MLKIKRIYDLFDKDDGFRILVDGLWPRGLTKEKAKIDLWLKEIAPSKSLREWFSHDPDKWAEFKNRYKKELKTKKELLERLDQLIKKEKKVTLLYGAKDEKHNNATALLEVIRDY
ncbi:MAG: DUF488 domain-containing protein [Minisyncoccales bacterium]|jgi:uncharacterized protein YeaO (DUF488 family)